MAVNRMASWPAVDYPAGPEASPLNKQRRLGEHPRPKTNATHGRGAFRLAADSE